MAQPIEDIVMKGIMELFQGDAVKFFGIDKRIVSATTISAATRTELAHIHIQKNIDDWVLEAEDNSFLHFEFQSDYDPDDLARFMVSDAMLYLKERKRVKTIVVYTADIEYTITTLDAGAIKYSVDTFYMSILDGDKTYEAIRAKVAGRETLNKQDLMSIVFIPMMKSGADKVTKFERAITLSKEVPDRNEQLQIQAMLKLLSDKFIKDPAMLQRLKEAINMTAIGEMIRDEGAIQRAIEIAQKMLRRGTSIEIVMEDTGLDEVTVRGLQEKLGMATA